MKTKKQDKKTAEETLAQELDKFKLAVDNASDHIVITDPEGIIIYANRAVEKTTGFGMKEAMGKKAGSKELWGGLMKKRFYQELWKTIKEDKKVFEGRFQNKKKNGERYVASANIAPVLNAKGEVIFFIEIERDVTKEYEIDKAKTEFVSLASHQLRTPLSSVNWYTEMLLTGDAGELTAEQRDYLEEIYRGNQRMVDLVNDLLNVSRLELGTFMVDPKPTNILSIGETILKELMPKIKEKELTVEKDFEEGLPEVKVDQGLMGIIFQNLLSNAVKYTPGEGTIKFGIKRSGNKMVIIVKDTGMGIPKHQKDKIFSKLFRADNVLGADTEGTGLGLYLIKSIVDSVGGNIRFESEEGKGTTFFVELPMSGMKAKKGTKVLSGKSENKFLLKEIKNKNLTT